MPILMCRPDYFGIEYEINAWMDLQVQADRELARQQWETLYETYRALGQEIILIDPAPGQPDMVFTANAGTIWKDTVVLSNFRHPERKGEEPFFAAFFEKYDGLRLERVNPTLAFEGAGDTLFLGDRLFFGSGFRTDRRVHEIVGNLLDVEVISLELADSRFYHLDTCFCPLSPEVALFAPMAFTPPSIDLIRKNVPHPIEVPEEVAAGFACNAMPIGTTVVSSLAILALEKPLQEAGFEVLGLPMSEFMKSGGGVRCLSLPLEVPLV